MILFVLLLQIDTLSIEQTIEKALLANPSYLESKASLDKARIQFYKSLSYLLPTTSATGSYTHSEYMDIETKTYNGSLNFTMPVFDTDIIGTIILTHGQSRSSKLQHDESLANLLLSIKKSYYNLIGAVELLASSDIAIKRAEENQKLVQTRYDLGAASRLELLQAEVFYLRALQDKSRARTLEATAQEELRAVLNTPRFLFPRDTLMVPDSIHLLPLDSLVVILRKVNYNIKTARVLSTTARSSFLIASLAFLPKVSVFYGYSTTSDSLTFDFEYCRDNARTNYGINVTFPIFELKSLIFNLLTAKKELKIQQLSQQRAVLETEKALHVSYYSLKESVDKLQFAQKSMEASSEATTIAREQYNLGTISFLDFLQAEEDYYTAKVSYIQTLSDFYIQKANFSYLLSGSAFEQ